MRIKLNIILYCPAAIAHAICLVHTAVVVSHTGMLKLGRSFDRVLADFVYQLKVTVPYSKRAQGSGADPGPQQSARRWPKP